MEKQGLYKTFNVGYLGDFAGVICELVKPTVSTSSCPKDRYHRQTFMVTTTSHSFNRKSLENLIHDIASEGSDIATLEFLKAAQAGLKKFIDVNGETNPNEALDWAPV